MAQNRVEYHIQAGGFFTFKVQAGQTVKIGEVVELAGDRMVKTAAADSKKVVGVVYSGTVGIDGVNTGYKGDNGDVATVVILKPFVWLTSSAAIPAGNLLKAAANGKVADLGAGTFDQEIGMAITAATAADQKILAVIG